MLLRLEGFDIIQVISNLRVAKTQRLNLDPMRTLKLSRLRLG